LTVIAYDGKSIAADRQISEGSVILAYDKKILPYSGGIWTSCGSVIDGEKFREWLEDRGSKKPKLGKDFGGLYTEDGVVWEVDQDLVPMKAYKHTGMGDGGQAVMHYMKLGMSAEEACKAVCKINVYCGGKIDVHKVSD
jgi:hypothetical protein